MRRRFDQARNEMTTETKGIQMKNKFLVVAALILIGSALGIGYKAYSAMKRQGEMRVNQIIEAAECAP